MPGRGDALAGRRQLAHALGRADQAVAAHLRRAAARRRPHVGACGAWGGYLGGSVCGGEWPGGSPPLGCQPLARHRPPAATPGPPAAAPAHPSPSASPPSHLVVAVAVLEISGPGVRPGADVGAVPQGVHACGAVQQAGRSSSSREVGSGGGGWRREAAGVWAGATRAAAGRSLQRRRGAAGGSLLPRPRAPSPTLPHAASPPIN